MHKPLITRILFIGCRFVFVFFAFKYFEGEDYNNYSTLVSIASLFVAIAGLELYTFSQKNSKSIPDYENKRFTQYLINLVIGIIVFTLMNKMNIVQNWIIFYFISEWLLLESIRYYNYKHNLYKSQLINLIIRGCLPLTILLFVYLFKYNLTTYFIFTGLSSLIVLIYLNRDIKLTIDYNFFFTTKIIATLPFISYVIVYRSFDVLMRNQINSLEDSDLTLQNYIHLALTVFLMIEGFYGQLWMQKIHNKILQQSFRFTIPIIFPLSVLGSLCLVYSFEFNGLIIFLLGSSFFIIFRTINSLFMTSIYKRMSLKIFFIFAGLDLMVVSSVIFKVLDFLSTIIFLFIILIIKILYEKNYFKGNIHREAS